MPGSPSVAHASVHVIDDDEAVRDSLAFLLRAAKFDVQTHESAVAFLAALPKVGPGCIITDVRMPEMSGIDLLRRLKELGVSAPVIVITGHGDVPLAVEAMKFGAVDFLEKPFDDDALLVSVRAALARTEQEEQRDAERTRLKQRLATLSTREREVLDGLIAGLPNKTIAYDLGISPRTVEIHRANVMTKLGVRSLSEALRIAFAAQER